MRIKKNITTRLNVRDPIALYQSPDALLGLLRRTFEGKCFAECFITTVNKIIREGECIINREGEPDFATVDVQFEVSAVVYNAGDIIPDMKISSAVRGGHIITGNSKRDPHLVVALKINEQLEALKAGEVVPVQVCRAKYRVMADFVAVSAIPIEFVRPSIAYRLTEKVDPQTLSDTLEFVLAEDSRAKDMRETQNDLWIKAQKMTYMYPAVPTPPQGVTVGNVLDIARQGGEEHVGMYLCRASTLDMSTKDIYISAEPPDGAARCDDLPPAEVLITMLFSYEKHIRFMRELIETITNLGPGEASTLMWSYYNLQRKK